MTDLQFSQAVAAFGPFALQLPAFRTRWTEASEFGEAGAFKPLFWRFLPCNRVGPRAALAFLTESTPLSTL